MRYANPALVQCPACRGDSSQRVAELLRLSAACPKCGAGLQAIGLKMRRSLDDWHLFCLRIQLAMEVEEVIGMEIADQEIEPVRTLRDLARAVAAHLPPGSGSLERAVIIVQDAARRLRPVVMTKLELDLPLLEALRPERWE
jgi:hypothetical protein